jgi:ABC-type lipoprotein export system ATPase subunit
MSWGCMITNAIVKWQNIQGAFSLEVDQLTLSTEQGYKMPVMGRTASGKSTLLSLMAGLKWPEQGEVCWTFPEQDKILWSSEKLLSSQERVKLRQDHFGFAFQNHTLLPHLNVQDNLIYPLELKGVMTKRACEKAEKTLWYMLLPEERQELKQLLQRFPNEISGGQYQRIALAQAVVHDPNVLFADEPTGNLDFETRRQVMNVLNNWLIQEEWKGKRMLIWVTHHPDDPQLYKAEKLLWVKHKDAHKATCYLKNITEYKTELEAIINGNI